MRDNTTSTNLRLIGSIGLIGILGACASETAASNTLPVTAATAAVDAVEVIETATSVPTLTVTSDTAPTPVEAAIPAATQATTAPPSPTPVEATPPAPQPVPEPTPEPAPEPAPAPALEPADEDEPAPVPPGPDPTPVVVESLIPVPPPTPPLAIDHLVDVDWDDLMCGPLPAIPGDALIGSDMWFDLDGGGVDDDRLVSYLHGGVWKLRGEVSGAQSELEIPGAGAHGVRVLGFADVDLTYGGEEIIAVVGGGASAVEVGVFTFLEGGCLMQYQTEGGDPFTLLSGASVMWGEGIICGEGYIADWGYQREEDDTYTLWGAAFEPISLGVFGYMPASDDYVEGLSFDDISTDLFDCNGLSI